MKKISKKRVRRNNSKRHYWPSKLALTVVSVMISLSLIGCGMTSNDDSSGGSEKEMMVNYKIICTSGNEEVGRLMPVAEVINAKVKLLEVSSYSFRDNLDAYFALEDYGSDHMSRFDAERGLQEKIMPLLMSNQLRNTDLRDVAFITQEVVVDAFEGFDNTQEFIDDFYESQVYKDLLEDQDGYIYGYDLFEEGKFYALTKNIYSKTDKNTVMIEMLSDDFLDERLIIGSISSQSIGEEASLIAERVSVVDAKGHKLFGSATIDIDMNQIIGLSGSYIEDGENKQLFTYVNCNNGWYVVSVTVL